MEGSKAAIIHKIISGGQTGVDRAGLDAAILNNIPHAGWCPRGRKSEDGLIPAKYRLTEHVSPFYIDRTEQNVVDSDGTLIIHSGKISKGTAKTYAFCKRHKKPALLLDAEKTTLEKSISEIDTFIDKYTVRILNIAGPRASHWPAGYDYAFKLINSWLSVRQLQSNTRR